MREFVEAYLSQKNLVEHQIDSYNDFIERLPSIIKNIKYSSLTPERGVFRVPLEKTGETVYIFIEDVWIDNPFNPHVPKILKDKTGKSVESGLQELGDKLRFDKVHDSSSFEGPGIRSRLSVPPLPMMCRIRNLTYSSPIKAIVRVYKVPADTSFEELKRMIKEGTADQYQMRFGDTIPVETTDKRIIEGNIITIGEIPIMLKSKLCWLNKDNVTKFLEINESFLLSSSGGKIRKPIPDELYHRILAEYFMEDPMDPGGYFIINGSERVIVPTEELAPNRIFVEKVKRSDKYIEVAKVYSHHREGYKALISVEKAPDGILYVVMPKSKNMAKIPLVVLLKALGLTDKEIHDLIAYSPEASLIASLNIEYVNEKLGIRNINDAIRYIAERLPGTQSIEVKIESVNNYLDREFLGHITDIISYVHKRTSISSENLRRILRHEKGRYLAQMARRVLRLATGNIPEDDKDHYSNKRLRLAGDLLAEIVKVGVINFFRQLCLQIQRKFQEAKSLEEKMLKKTNFVNFTKPDAFNSKIHKAMATGEWPGKRTGISQIIERTSYLSTLGILRRVRSTLKRDQPHFEARDLHPTQWGRLCPNETPEGQNCGLVKNLALGASISRIVRRNAIFKTLRLLGVRPVAVETNMPTVYVNNLPIGVVAGDLERLREVLIEVKGEVLSKALILDRVQEYLEGKRDFENIDGLIRSVVSDVVGREFARKLLEAVSHLPQGSYSQKSVIKTIGTMNKLIYGLINEAEVGDQILDITREVLQELVISYENISSFKEFLTELIEENKLKEKYPQTVEALTEFADREVGYILSAAKEILLHFISDITLIINGTERAGYYDLIYTRAAARIVRLYISKKYSKDDALKALREERQKVVETILENIMRIIRPHENLETGSSEYARYYRRAVIYGQYLKASAIREVTSSQEIKEIILELTRLLERDVTISELVSLMNGLLSAYDAIIMTWKRPLISETLNTLKALRRGYLIHIKHLASMFKAHERRQINVRYDEITDEIYVLADAGRIRRPLISVRTLVRRAVLDDLYKVFSQNPEISKITNDVRTKMLFMKIVLRGLVHYMLPNDVIDVSLKNIDAFEIPWEDDTLKENIDNVKEILSKVLSEITVRLRIFGSDEKLKKLGQIVEQDKDAIINAIVDYLVNKRPSIRELALRELESIRRDLKEGRITWHDLVLNGIVEFIDADEEENVYVALYPEDLNDEHTHIEVDPLLILGLAASMIPYPEYNASPRNVYGANMMRQAIGLPFVNFKYRPDTRQHIMFYPERPIVRSVVSKYVGFEHRPAGQNLVVAVISYEGYNMQDAIIFNKAALERGLMRSVSFRTYETQEHTYAMPGAYDEIVNPISEHIMTRYKPSKKHRPETYEKLDDDGIARVGSRVKGNYAVIGKISPTRFGGEGLIALSRGDNSVRLSPEEFGVVDAAYATSVPGNDKNLLVKVKVRSHMVPQIGDKFASRHGQKGVIGLIVPEEDMPFTEDGIIPDVIFNPHAIPSRKTIGHILEMLAGKVGALEGREVDGTPFSGEKEIDLREALKKLGFSYRGVEVLYDGRTGKRFTAEIYMGVIYYQRLHHLVEDKIHARSRGPVQILTKQPTEGRSRHGGLRFGEMEKDCLIGHGAAMALKDRLLDESDKTVIYVCGNCGNIVDEIESGGVAKRYCRVCGTSDNIHPVEVSYAFKLLMDELKSMLVFPRLRLGDVL